MNLNKQLINQANVFIPMKIISTGSALPPNKLEAAELDKRLNKPEGYSLKRSGIAYRYHADYQMSQAELAVQALNDALIHNNISPSSIDLLISAWPFPSKHFLIVLHIFLQSAL